MIVETMKLWAPPGQKHWQIDILDARDVVTYTFESIYAVAPDIEAGMRRGRGRKKKDFTSDELEKRLRIMNPNTKIIMT